MILNWKEEYMDKIIESITKIIKLTQENKMKWESSSPDNERIIKDDDSYAMGSVYKSNYKEKHLRIYKRRFKVNEPNYATSVSGLDIFGTKKYPYWDVTIILEITDYQGNSLWKFPYASSLEDLFSAIEYQVADVKGFLDNIAND
jgi:hypothetical protein